MRATTPARSTWSAPRGAIPHPPRTARPAGLAAVYRRRDPTATPLYPIVQHHLETFLADAAAADPHGEGLPRWVEDDFRAYLRCGVLANRFAPPSLRRLRRRAPGRNLQPRNSGREQGTHAAGSSAPNG